MAHQPLNYDDDGPPSEPQEGTGFGFGRSEAPFFSPCLPHLPGFNFVRPDQAPKTVCEPPRGLSHPPVTGRQHPSPYNHTLSQHPLPGFDLPVWPPTTGWGHSNNAAFFECHSPPDPTILTNPFPFTVGPNHWGSHALVAGPSMTLGQGIRVLPSSHGYGPTSIITSLASPQGRTLSRGIIQPSPHGPRIPTPGSSRLGVSFFQRLRGYKPQHTDRESTCWRCSLMHKRVRMRTRDETISDPNMLEC